MKKLLSFVIAIVTCLLFDGCAGTSLNFSQYYRAKIPLQKAPTALPAQSVTGAVFESKSNNKPNPEALALENSLIGKQNYILLGLYSFEGARPITPLELAQMTANQGGDYYIHIYASNGMRSGTRMVMTGFTTPNVITSTSQGSAYGNFNGNYQNNYGGMGTINGTAMANGYGSSQTVVGGSQTFQAMPYTYQAIGNVVLVLASPNRVWQLIHDGTLIIR